MIRVYHEDVDLGGIVYHANYLKYIERARTDWVRGLGIDQATLKAETGIIFVVSHLEARYLAPARFGDDLEVTLEVAETTPARLVLRQEVRRGAQVLFAARVTLVALGPSGRPVRLPAALLAGIR